MAPAVWAVGGLCLLAELALLGADHGLWGSARWRPLAYGYGAFWAGLLHGWMPNFALQPATMFLSHAWLHAGPVHLAGNLGALLWLGPLAVARRGQAGFLVLWLGTTLGGGLAFGLLTRSPAPMVGASGALFGLAATLAIDHARGMATALRRVLSGAASLAGLLLLNAAAWALAGGHLAWQTHLGGMAAGTAMALLWRPKRERAATGDDRPH